MDNGKNGEVFCSQFLRNCIYQKYGEYFGQFLMFAVPILVRKAWMMKWQGKN